MEYIPSTALILEGAKRLWYQKNSVNTRYRLSQVEEQNHEVKTKKKSIFFVNPSILSFSSKGIAYLQNKTKLHPSLSRILCQRCKIKPE